MADEECPNYHGNGNAGPFAYTSWEYLLPFLAYGWVLLIGIELAFLFAPPQRSGANRRAVRATVALVMAAVLGYWFPVGLAVTCG